MKFFFRKYSALKQASFFVFFCLSFVSSISYANVGEEKPIKKAVINWMGSKVTGSHDGLVNLKSGYLNFNETDLVGGEFIIDMASIVCTDLSGKGKASLESHLKSADFFDVGNYPLARLRILNAEKKGGEKEFEIKGEQLYSITGIITVKDIPQKISFKASVGKTKATARFVLDRTLFGIIYKSGNFFKELADKAINDEFEMQIQLMY
ncbi:MAG: lipid-binding protein [Flavobacteriales bacterium]|nr:lipid-binding protein [Flavobacteriales bacterium]